MHWKAKNGCHKSIYFKSCVLFINIHWKCFQPHYRIFQTLYNIWKDSLISGIIIQFFTSFLLGWGVCFIFNTVLLMKIPHHFLWKISRFSPRNYFNDLSFKTLITAGWNAILWSNMLATYWYWQILYSSKHINQNSSTNKSPPMQLSLIKYHKIKNLTT